jgi:hypothetical protein
MDTNHFLLLQLATLISQQGFSRSYELKMGAHDDR